MDIKSSKKVRGEIEVKFENGYSTHGTTSIGTPTDEPGNHKTAWGWINHLRSKMWWQPGMEFEFLREIGKHL